MCPCPCPWPWTHRSAPPTRGQHPGERRALQGGVLGALPLGVSPRPSALAPAKPHPRPTASCLPSSPSAPLPPPAACPPAPPPPSATSPAAHPCRAADGRGQQAANAGWAWQGQAPAGDSCTARVRGHAHVLQREGGTGREGHRQGGARLRAGAAARARRSCWQTSGNHHLSTSSLTPTVIGAARPILCLRPEPTQIPPYPP